MIGAGSIDLAAARVHEGRAIVYRIRADAAHAAGLRDLARAAEQAARREEHTARTLRGEA